LDPRNGDDVAGAALGVTGQRRVLLVRTADRAGHLPGERPVHGVGSGSGGTTATSQVIVSLVPSL
jgi:hypothetical protein